MENKSDQRLLHVPPMASLSKSNLSETKQHVQTPSVPRSLSSSLGENSQFSTVFQPILSEADEAGTRNTVDNDHQLRTGGRTGALAASRQRRGLLAIIGLSTAGIGALAGGVVLVAAKVGVILASKIFYPRAWPYVRTICLLQVDHVSSKLPMPVQKATAPFRPFARPMLGLTLAAPVVQTCFPDFWRTIRYWRRLLPIYTGYMRTKFAVMGKPVEERTEIWAERHEWGGEKVFRLVLEMSGFYVKSAQVLASKSDFMPEPWVRRLSVLFDNAPPRPFEEVSRSMRQQLALTPSGKTLGKRKQGLPSINTYFRSVDSEALAAASIAQVHSGVLLDGTPAVIKVQHVGVEILMHSDLRNIGRVAAFLKNQLPFDLTAVVKEIQSTIPLEFDFEREVSFMVRIKDSLEKNGFEKVVCPAPFVDLCSKRMLVMERLHGVPFTRILESASTPGGDTMAAKAASAVCFLIQAYGQMLLVDGVFHADPHPGNLLLMPDGRLGLLDFGQSKALDDESKVLLAKLILALAEGENAAIAEALGKAGFGFGGDEESTPDDATLAKMAYMMFDTRPVPEALVSPLSQDSPLQSNPLTKFNQSLWLVVRTVLLLRGLSHSLKMDVSAAIVWKPYALQTLKKLTEPLSGDEQSTHPLGGEFQQTNGQLEN